MPETALDPVIALIVSDLQHGIVQRSKAYCAQEQVQRAAALAVASGARKLPVRQRHDRFPRLDETASTDAFLALLAPTPAGR